MKDKIVYASPFSLRGTRLAFRALGAIKIQCGNSIRDGWSDDNPQHYNTWGFAVSNEDEAWAIFAKVKKHFPDTWKMVEDQSQYSNYDRVWRIE